MNGIMKYIMNGYIICLWSTHSNIEREYQPNGVAERSINYLT